MIILFLIMVATFLVSASAFMQAMDYKNTNSKKFAPCVAITVLFFVLFIASTAYTMKSWTSPSVTTERVAYLYDAENREFDEPLYYDVETDEYFVVEDNLFNVLNPTSRIVVDGEDAKEYVDAYNALTQIEVERKK